MNIQYIGELSEQVEKITGKRTDETVPVSFIKSADEIELVDVSPEEPIERAPEEQVDSKRREQQLSQLRELALVLAADIVDHQLQKYLDQRSIVQQFGTNERIPVCVTPRTNVQEMIETAQMIAEKFHGEFIVAYVTQPNLAASDQVALEQKLQVARAASAHIEILEGDDPVSAILDFAKSRGITQLFIGHSRRSGIGSRLRGDPVSKLIQQSRGMDERVFPQ